MINWLILFFKIFELNVSVALGELKNYRDQPAYFLLHFFLPCIPPFRSINLTFEKCHYLIFCFIFSKLISLYVLKNSGRIYF